MRPEKKRTKHHDSVKCEAKAKQKAAAKAKKEGNVEHEVSEEAKLPSNWAKYEMPPSSDEENEDISATGAEFQFVLDNSSKATDFLQLKAEKEWESKQAEFTSEFFALNLSNLESLVDTLPFHQLVDIPTNSLDVSTVKVLEANAQKCEEVLKTKLSTTYESVDDVNKKIVEKLKIKEEVMQPQAAKSEPKPAKTEDDLEDWLNEYLSD